MCFSIGLFSIEYLKRCLIWLGVVTFPISEGSRILLALCWLFSMRHFSATAINCSVDLAALVVVSMLFLMLSSSLDWILCFLMESLRWRSSIRDWYWKLLNCSIL